MCTVNMTASHIYRRCQNLIRFYHIHKKAYRHNIGNRILSPDFMKMDIRDRLPMSMGLRFGDKPVNLYRIFLNITGYLKVTYDMFYIMHFCVMVVLMFRSVFVLLMFVVMFMFFMMVVSMVFVSMV